MNVPRITVPAGKLVVSYGGGVNTIGTLVLLKRLGARPEAIVMVDPGSEWRATYKYRDEVMQPWLEAAGFPPVTTITRVEEGKHVERAWRLETLHDECMRTKSIPSIAYGWKKCSQKYKGDTQRWWIRRQPFALEAWREVARVVQPTGAIAVIEDPILRQVQRNMDLLFGKGALTPRRSRRARVVVEVTGEKLVKVIGYDVDERHRVKSAFQDKWEDQRFSPYYPLVEAGFGRDECVDLIADEGLPPAQKSACTHCPNNTLAEWERLRVEEPPAFALAVAMSRNAEGNIESPDVVGLMRCNPHGKRQLHVWADGGYPELPPARLVDEGDLSDMPCECAL